MTLLDLVHAKLLRIRSVAEATTSDPDYSPNFESIEDSARDAINYLSFLVSYSRGRMSGQSPDRDAFNRLRKK